MFCLQCILHPNQFDSLPFLQLLPPLTLHGLQSVRFLYCVCDATSCQGITLTRAEKGFCTCNLEPPSVYKAFNRRSVIPGRRIIIVAVNMQSCWLTICLNRLHAKVVTKSTLKRSHHVILINALRVKPTYQPITIFKS